MVEEGADRGYLEKGLADLDDELEKIDFLENSLRENSKIPLESLVFIYENLAELNYRIGKPKGSFYQKAGSIWEILSAFEKSQGENSVQSKTALRNSLKNYKLSFEIYRKEKSLSGMEETKNKIRQIKKELRRYGGSLRKVAFFSAVLLFISSLLFLSPPTTGFAISNLPAEESTLTGAVLGVLFILILVIIIIRGE